MDAIRGVAFLGRRPGCFGRVGGRGLLPVAYAGGAEGPACGVSARLDSIDRRISGLAASVVGHVRGVCPWYRWKMLGGCGGDAGWCRLIQRR